MTQLHSAAALLRLLVFGLMTFGSGLASALPPLDFELEIYLTPDFESTIYTDFGHNRFDINELQDPDEFRKLEDCQCETRASVHSVYPGCSTDDMDYICFCETVAQSRYVMLFRDDIPAGVSYSDAARLNYSLQLPGSDGSTWSADFPRLIASDVYPGSYGVNHGYDSGSEMATTVAASYNQRETLIADGEQVLVKVDQRTSTLFPMAACTFFNIIEVYPYSIFAGGDSSTIVSSAYTPIAGLDDFSVIQLTDNVTGESFFYQPVAFIEPALGKALKVRYSNPCPEDQADADGRCGVVDPEKDLGEDECDNGRFQGNPVNTALGNKFQREVDYQGSGPMPLSWERNYNSHTGQWVSTPRLFLTPVAEAVKVRRSDGRVTTWSFYRDAWHAAGNVTDSLVQLRDELGLPGGWSLRSRDGIEHIFAADGKLREKRHRSGLLHTYTHQDNLLEIIDTYGRSLSVFFNAAGYPLAMLAPDETLTQYQYDNRQRLVGVQYADGTARSYLYGDAAHPKALTGLVDENGVLFASWTYDTEGRAKSSWHAGGAGRVSMNYSHLDDLLDPRVTVTNSLGKQNTYHFSTKHGVRRVRYVVGHPSANCAAAYQRYWYTNGFVSQKLDWEGRKTRIERDHYGRALVTTRAVGTSEEHVVSTQWHPDYDLPLVVSEPGLTTSYSYDEVGNLLSVSKVVD